MSVTLVTGSARGLGRRTAEELLDEGDRVHVVWRSSRHRQAELEDRFGAECVHRADLANERETHALVEAVLAAEGRLDRIVHAVGAYESGTTSSLDAGVLHRLWQSNVLTAAHLMDAAREPLRASGKGRAIFFGTAGLAGHRARSTTAGYSSAKSALLVLVRSWATEEAGFGVTVNMVSPGHVPHADAHPDTLDSELHQRLPAGRAGDPREVAEAVRWLLSDAAGYTTGTDLQVGGGWML